MTDLRAVLELATDQIDHLDMAGTALTTAGRRRSRRRGVIASVAAGVVVASVAVVPRLFDSTEPVREPTDTPAPDPQITVVPPIDENVIQETWDPRRVAELPWENRTLLPNDLTPGTSADRTGERLVAVVDDGRRLHVVTDGERWQDVDYPEPLFEIPDTTVSPDGQRVIVTGASGLWSRDVDSSAWRRVAYPDGFLPQSELPARLLPNADATTYLTQGDRTWLVDLESGAAERQPFSVEGATASSTGVVGFGLEGGTRTIVEWGAEPRTVNADGLEYLQAPVADSGSLLAASRVNSSYYEPRTGADLDGLIVLDRTDLRTIAYLPVVDDEGWVEGGGLRALDWLGNGTVLMSVIPPDSGGQDLGTRYLVTWNPESGKLARVSSLPASYDLSLATAVVD
jgi:hypothetical protein